MAPGKRYRTPDAAAIAALNEIMATSRGMNREYGGRIYMNMDGTFSYTVPIQGRVGSMPRTGKNKVRGRDWDWYPPDANLAGSYHTHGRQLPRSTGRFSPPHLSKADIRSAYEDGVPEYVGFPGQRIGLQGNKIVKYIPRHRVPRPSDFEILQGPQSLPKVDIAL